MSGMTRLAVKVSPDARTERVDLGANAYPVISEAVQGDIEPVTLAEDFEFYANENGWAEFSPLERNPLAETVQLGCLGAANPIVGPVIFTGGIDEAGETRGLSETRAALVEQLAMMMRGEA